MDTPKQSFREQAAPDTLGIRAETNVIGSYFCLRRARKDDRSIRRRWEHLSNNPIVVGPILQGSISKCHHRLLCVLQGTVPHIAIRKGGSQRVD
eukprot:1618386-Lingulodinium_polyedra.AAC.1